MYLLTVFVDFPRMPRNPLNKSRLSLHAMPKIIKKSFPTPLPKVGIRLCNRLTLYVYVDTWLLHRVLLKKWQAICLIVMQTCASIGQNNTIVRWYVVFRCYHLYFNRKYICTEGLLSPNVTLSRVCYDKIKPHLKLQQYI